MESRINDGLTHNHLPSVTVWSVWRSIFFRDRRVEVVEEGVRPSTWTRSDGRTVETKHPHDLPLGP